MNGGDEPWPRTVVLSGIGGAGKTSIALAYAHRHTDVLGVAWQFPADDATVLAAGFSELAAQLGVRDVVDARDPVFSVHSALAALTVPWLLIFDNAPDQVSVAPYVPPAGHAALVPTMKKTLGREHPKTLAARAKLARWTGKSGNPAGARDQDADLLPVYRRDGTGRCSARLPR